MSLLHQIAVTYIKGIGPNLAKNIIAYVGSAEGIWEEKEKNLEKIPGIGSVLSRQILKQKAEALISAEKEINFIEKNNIQPFYFLDKDYPYRLKECPDSPIMLYGKGNLHLNEGRFISIIGTRKATERGKENCIQLIQELRNNIPDITIVSGLAYGIDVCAHKASLEVKVPTIGILGHGLDRIYPFSHRSISNQMQENGGLLTEFTSGTNPDKSNFVQRNRIIAGLCDATIVIESKPAGGAIITANLANDYNRDVFAFPGRITDEFSSGCNYLIKSNKASLIESAEDLIKFMNWEKRAYNPNNEPLLFIDLSEDEEKIIQLIRQYPDGIQSNEISVLLSYPFSKISALLLQMEFKNLVKCLPGNRYCIVR